nr:MAG TPA: hypothetical protein [Caudoviricetes sp.]DAS81415.1 MAG TPA: hypothetical protein [Caudoviricetes sp.]
MFGITIIFTISYLVLKRIQVQRYKIFELFLQFFI